MTISSAWSWYVANQALIWAALSGSVSLLDWWMARNPNSKADGVLHYIEIQLRSLLGLSPLPTEPSIKVDPYAK